MKWKQEYPYLIILNEVCIEFKYRIDIYPQVLLCKRLYSDYAIANFMSLTEGLKGNIKNSLIYNTSSPGNILCLILWSWSSSKSYLFFLVMLQLWKRMLLGNSKRLLIFTGKNFWELLESKSVSNFAGIHFNEWMEMGNAVLCAQS